MGLTGIYTGADGVARCRRLGKPCLSRRQALALAKKADRRDPYPAQAFHCRACATWHYGYSDLERPRRRRLRFRR